MLVSVCHNPVMVSLSPDSLKIPLGNFVLIAKDAVVMISVLKSVDEINHPRVYKILTNIKIVPKNV